MNSKLDQLADRIILITENSGLSYYDILAVLLSVKRRLIYKNLKE